MRGPKMAHRKIIVSNSLPPPPYIHTHTHALRHFERIIAMHALHMIVWGRFFFLQILRVDYHWNFKRFGFNLLGFKVPSLQHIYWKDPKLGQGMTSPYSVDTVYSFACSSGICGSPEFDALTQTGSGYDFSLFSRYSIFLCLLIRNMWFSLVRCIEPVSVVLRYAYSVTLPKQCYTKFQKESPWQPNQWKNKVGFETKDYKKKD